MLSFDPTDILRVPASKTVLHVLVENGYRDFLNTPAELEPFLEFHQLTQNDLIAKSSGERILQVQHPLSYEKSHAHRELLVTHRTRSLSLFLHQAKNLNMNDILAGLRKDANILEIGSGNGRLILELRERFPEAFLTGVTKFSGEENYNGKESSAIISQLFHLPAPDDRMEFVFRDLDQETLPGADNFYDLIISQRSIRYIRRKKELLEEIYRKLTPRVGFFLPDRKICWS